MREFPNDSKAASQATMLLVEDSFADRGMPTRRLRRRGRTVCSAPDGSTGVAMSVSDKPDLILMDVAMGERDTSGLKALQDLCGEYGATLLVDVAHAMGAMGPGGRAGIREQGMPGKVDIVMGSFSKTFGSNGGFVQA